MLTPFQLRMATRRNTATSMVALTFFTFTVLSCCQLGKSTETAPNLSGQTASSGSSGVVSLAVDDTEAQPQASNAEEMEKVFDGPQGAKSLEDMLHWAISHSDHEQLKSQADAVRKKANVAEVLEQRKRVQDLLEHMRQQPTEADLMKEAIVILHDTNATLEEQYNALQALQFLVEPIDSANDLGPLNGIQPVVERLGSSSNQLQLAAAYVIGTAASNNVKFQQQLFSVYPDVFDKLLDVAASDDHATASKGLYAVASLVRNLEEARTAFYEAGGLITLKDIVSSGSAASQLKRKALNLIADLVNGDQELKGITDQVVSLVHAVCTLLLNTAYEDVHEEALLAVKEMASSPTARAILLELPVVTILHQVKLQYQKAQSAVQQDAFEFEYYQERLQLCASAIQALKDVKVEL